MKSRAHRFSWAGLICLAGLVGLLQGCAEVGMSNPFESSPPTQAPSEIFFDQFSDVPIPSDMSVDRNRTLVTTAQDGTRIGLITAEGRVDVSSLNNAMIHNMARQGWSLRATTSGVKTIQIYEKSNRFVVLYTYDQAFNTAMEIWVAQRLGEGAYPAPDAGSGSAPNFYLDPAPMGGAGAGAGAGGATQQGLTQ